MFLGKLGRTHEWLAGAAGIELRDGELETNDWNQTLSPIREK
jgi:hypothetical protein